MKVPRTSGASHRLDGRHGHNSARPIRFNGVGSLTSCLRRPTFDCAFSRLDVVIPGLRRGVQTDHEDDQIGATMAECRRCLSVVQAPWQDSIAGHHTANLSPMETLFQGMRGASSVVKSFVDTLDLLRHDLGCGRYLLSACQRGFDDLLFFQELSRQQLP